MNEYEKRAEELEIQRRECNNPAEAKMLRDIVNIYKILAEMRKLNDAECQLNVTTQRATVL